MFRHLKLRHRYCTVYVRTDNTVVDAHQHFVEGAGHTEHALFVESLLRPAASLAVPKGKASSGPGKRASKQARSERLRTMLQPPVALASQEGVALPLQDLPAEMSDQVMSAEATVELLPGAAQVPSAVGALQACSSEAELLCMARTKKGDRCKNARCQGNFCKCHNEEAASRKFMLAFFTTVDAAAQQAMFAWEQSQTELALKNSLEKNLEVKQQIATANKILDDRVAAMSRRRAPVPAKNV
ncbi:unnamed protein product [Effrenium voratum]|nr:unnamed protein product [Effrenium voratum]